MSLITYRAKLQDADWLRLGGIFFLNLEGMFGDQEGVIT